MKKLVLISFSLILISISGSTQAATVLADSWSNVVNGRSSDQNTAWWSGAEAVRITENVLLYQRACGGWPKNINMQLVLTNTEKAAILVDKPKNTEATIDNGACTYELLYLSKVYKASTDAALKLRIETAFMNGIKYYMSAQYSNGGWPQFFPLKSGYYTHITYNDNAMYNVLENLRHVYQKDTYYSIIAPDSIVNKAKAAFDKGIQCIMKTQYTQKMKLTTWCAQHDEKTLLPAQARAYELPSLSGAESASLIKMLASLQNPTKEIKRAIYSGVYWYNKVRIKGQRLESFTNSDGLADKRVVADATAADMWARFYRLADNRPFFCDRDGIMKFSLAEIGYERRNGYSWYNTSGNDVMTTYSNWLPRCGTTVMTAPLTTAALKSTDTIPVIAFANKYQTTTLKKFDLLLNAQLLKSYTTAAIDTTLTGLKGGNYTIIARAEYNSGVIESDTLKFSVTGTSDIAAVEQHNRIVCISNGSSNGLIVKAEGLVMQKVEIITIQGQLIYQSRPQSEILSIHDLPLSLGIYLIRVTDTSGRVYLQKHLAKSN